MTSPAPSRHTTGRPTGHRIPGRIPTHRARATALALALAAAGLATAVMPAAAQTPAPTAAPTATPASPTPPAAAAMPTTPAASATPAPLPPSPWPPQAPRTAEACTDFDAFINGEWAATAEIPADRARTGSFDQLRVANNAVLERALKDLVEGRIAANTPGLRLLAAHYGAGMDLAAIEKHGMAPVQPWLARIDGLQRAGLVPLLAEMGRLQVGAPLALFVNRDARDATRHVLQLSQSGLTLPDRDDYTGTDDTSRRLQQAWRTYARALLEGAGQRVDDARLDALYAFESQIAAASSTRVALRDPVANYNAHTLASLQALAPQLDWTAMLGGYTGRSGEALAQVPLVVGQPAFVQAAARWVAETPLPVWQDYLRLRLMDAAADKLPRAVAQAHFDYRERTLRGLRAEPSRHDQLVLAIGGGTGGSPLAQTLGELFVLRAFSPRAQQRAEAMVADIRAAMAQRLEALPWMSAETKRQARAKLDAMVAQIGGPAQWPDYSGLTLARDDYAGNALRVALWDTQRRLADLDQPVDRFRWQTSPHIVNAFAAGGNRIVFPAGILQPPFFDENADDASNYGAIGGVIGHEIIHHFDDRGRQFDAMGQLKDWWAPADAAAYRERADRIAALYSAFEGLPGLRVNGRQTLGENISDIGGIRIAYDGLQIALARQRAAGRPVAAVDGMTPQQRFFRAWGLIWRDKMRAEALAQQIRTGQHSPPRFRALAPLQQAPEFARAFGCKAGDLMVAAEPILIW
jgi:predicted metalloendopeptidase